MATLKNLTINDTGYIRLPQGTTAERPTVPTITINGFAKPLGVAKDGLPLFIPGEWNTYYSLPDYLKGLQTTMSINDSDTTSFSCSHATRVYLMRQTGWNAVDTSGYTLIESSKPYMGVASTTEVYYKDFSAGGPYTIDNNSAMYLFSPLAAGTTLSVGSMRFNTTTGFAEVWDGGQWLNMTDSIGSATGGAISGASVAGGYVIHTYTTAGASTFTPLYSGKVEVLVVGGGGCGAGLSGGGGGGGVVYNSSYSVVGGVSYNINVGAGGPGPSSHSPGSGATAGQGGTSYFGGSQQYNGIVGYGGGHGGYWTGPAAPGGSGGGGPGHNGSNGQRPAGDGVVGQGHPGGYGHHGNGPASWLSPQPGICVYGGGGGGGAGEKGHSRYSWRAQANGGNGMVSSIRGTQATYYGGGGGGGVHAPSGNYGADYSAGGLGGGGSSYSGGPQARHDGRTNTGGGGGGAYHPDTYRSGNGGPGIVVVRYKR